MVGITAIFSMVSNAEQLLNSVWTAYNTSSMVEAKKAQMTQSEIDAHNKLLNTAMHGTATERAAALTELQNLVAE